MPLLLELFLTFAKIGMFTFGGGYAMISIIEDTCVERKKWMTHDEMMNMTVIAESTPGPMAINCATYVGYKHKGFMGAIASTFGMVLPSFVIIYIISMFLDGFMELTLVANAFKGIKIGVGIIILDVGIKMLKKMWKHKRMFARVMTFSAFAVMLLINILSLRISSIVLLLLAGAISLSIFAIQGAPEKADSPTEKGGSET